MARAMRSCYNTGISHSYTGHPTMSFETETARNAWVARQLGVANVYRDDVDFVDQADPEGKTAAFITVGENEREVLIRNTAPYDTLAEVPHDYLLGLR
jgi:hypothetical protein